MVHPYGYVYIYTHIYWWYITMIFHWDIFKIHLGKTGTSNDIMWYCISMCSQQNKGIHNIWTTGDRTVYSGTTRHGELWHINHSWYPQMVPMNDTKPTTNAFSAQKGHGVFLAPSGVIKCCWLGNPRTTIWLFNIAMERSTHFY